MCNSKLLLSLVHIIVCFLFNVCAQKAKHAHALVDLYPISQVTISPAQCTHLTFTHTFKIENTFPGSICLHSSPFLFIAMILQGCDVPCHDGNVGPLGSAPGALSAHDHLRTGVQLWGVFCTATHRLHLPDFRLACGLLHLW